DGHPTRGRFAFTVKASAAASTESAMPSDTTRVVPPASPRGNALVGAPTDSSAAAPREQGATRWPEFMALLTIIGVVTFRFVIVPGLDRQGVPTADLLDSALRLGRASLVLLLLATWARLYMEMRTMLGARASAPG